MTIAIAMILLGLFGALLSLTGLFFALWLYESRVHHTTSMKLLHAERDRDKALREYIADKKAVRAAIRRANNLKTQVLRLSAENKELASSIVVFTTPEEGQEHDETYDITCELCNFKNLNCEYLYKICGEGSEGYFKRNPECLEYVKV